MSIGPRRALDCREVAKVLNARIAMRQQRGTERIDLREPGWPETQTGSHATVTASIPEQTEP